MRALALVPVALLVFALSACGDADPDGPDAGTGGSAGAGGAGGGGGLELPEIEWLACPSGPGACTSVEVPLDWEHPEDGPTLPFFVRRIPAEGGPSKGQLWLLQGGPGAAGWAMVDLAPAFRALAPGYDILVPDYRGTGHSAWLGCERITSAPLDPQCLRDLRGQWGDGLRHFSTTAAVHDIRYVAEALRREGDRILFYGVSYGTFVLNRLLTLYPDLPDAALLDSVCPASGCDVRMDHNAVRVVQHAFSFCGDDAFCSERLGADPWGRAMALFDAMEQGHCAEFVGYPRNVELLGELMIYGGLYAETLPVALAAVYRAERCSPDDVVALEQLVENLWGIGGFDPFDAPAAEDSIYLSLHVVYSEFWPEDLTEEQAYAELDALPFELGTLRGWVDLRRFWSWPVVPTPAAEKVWASTDAPILMLNGDLDAQTHIDGLAGVEATFRNASQQLVEVPMAGHAVLFSSHLVDRDFTCGMQMARDFFADPATPVDASCTANVPPIDVRGSPWMARYLMGTDDLWEAEGVAGQALLAPLDVRESWALGALRRNLREGLSF